MFSYSGQIVTVMARQLNSLFQMDLNAQPACPAFFSWQHPAPAQDSLRDFQEIADLFEKQADPRLLIDFKIDKN